MIDPQKGFIYSTADSLALLNQSISSVNIKPAFIYKGNKLRVGIELSHINNSNSSFTNEFYNKRTETAINASYLFNLQPKWDLIPMIRYTNTFQNKLLELHTILIYSLDRKQHFLDLIFSNQRSIAFKYGINFNQRFRFFAQLNKPLVSPDYFPISVQGGVQYSFNKKTK